MLHYIVSNILYAALLVLAVQIFIRTAVLTGDKADKAVVIVNNLIGIVAGCLATYAFTVEYFGYLNELLQITIGLIAGMVIGTVFNFVFRLFNLLYIKFRD